METFLDFLLFPEVSLELGDHMDPIWPENDFGKILDWRLSEIQAPGTPGVSHGTKILGSKIFSYHPQMMLFYAFCGFVLQKRSKNGKNRSFPALLAITMRFGENYLFFPFFAIFGKANSQNA